MHDSHQPVIAGPVTMSAAHTIVVAVFIGTFTIFEAFVWRQILPSLAVSLCPRTPQAISPVRIIEYAVPLV